MSDKAGKVTPSEQTLRMSKAKHHVEAAVEQR